MDDNKTPAPTIPTTQPTNPPPPIDLTEPASDAQAQNPTMPTEHEIAPEPTTSTSMPDAPSPVMAATDAVAVDASTTPPSTETTAPQAPAASTPPTEPNTIPPMPTIDALPPMPAADSSASVATSPAPDIATSSPAESIVGTASANAVSAPAPTEAKPGDDPKPKKSKALVIVVIVLALIALTLGGLVIWRAAHPATSSIEESMTPPAVAGVEDVEEIVEEEVIVEQPDETADWETFSNQAYSFKYPTNWDVTATLEDDFPEDQKYVGDKISINNAEKTVGIIVTTGEHSWGGTGRESIQSTPISFSINSQDYQSEESIIDNHSARTHLTIPFNGKDYIVLFGSGYPITNDPTASLDDYNRDKNTILQVLSTFKFSDPSTTPSAALQGSCTQDGVNYADGDGVPAPDSCNSCACNDGQIACTLMACEE